MRVPRLATSVRNLTLWGHVAEHTKGNAALSHHTARTVSAHLCPILADVFAGLVARYMALILDRSLMLAALEVAAHASFGKQSSTLLEIRSKSNVGIVHS